MLFSLFFVSLSTYAQNPKEYKTQVIDGVEYYIYTVQPSEGLYRISVNFGVTQDEILKTNPELQEGLKSGQVLLIPKKAGVQPQSTASTTTSEAKSTTTTKKSVPVDIIAASFASAENKENAGQKATTEKAAPQNTEIILTSEPHFYYHQVKKQQTLYSLSKEYGVKQADIIKYNPQAASGIREGEVLRIPKPEEIYAEKKEEKLQEDLSVKYLIHKVEPKETLYSISKKYDVKIEDIRKVNPDLEVLSINQELKIPYYTGLLTTETIDGEKTTFIDWDKILEKKDTVVSQSPLRIAFLLPFILENKNDPSASRFVEFYAGALKAIYEAKDANISIEVRTYDTGKTAESINEVFTKNYELRDADLIVGPTYSSQVAIASRFAYTNRVKMLIPFTSRIPEIETNPYIFQFNTVNSDIEFDFLSKTFASKWNNMNYIFVDLDYIPANDEGLIISQKIKEILTAQGKKYTTISLSSAEAAINLFEKDMVYNKKNMVIFNTDRFSYVESYLEALNWAAQRYNVVLLERYGWKVQEINRPSGFYVAPFRSEHEMKNLAKYNSEFLTLFGWEVTSNQPRYDLWGYDLTHYFIKLLSDRKKDLTKELELPVYKDGIQSQIHFKRDSATSGFINRQLYIGESQVK